MLSHYGAVGLSPWPSLLIESLGGAGGFSGAEFWRIRSSRQTLCLRRWPPEHPSPKRLLFQHAVLRHVHQQGVKIVPVPLAADDGTTFVTVEGRMWELAPWLPGEADFRQNPSRARLEAALRALAQFHAAAALFPTNVAPCSPSPGLRQRLEMVRRWLSGDGELLERRIVDADWRELAQRARRLLPMFRALAPAIDKELADAAPALLPQQPVLRDIWHDHVLFEGDRVSGLIDFGAMQIDSVAGDVARLLGSLARDDADLWRVGLSAYEAIRPLSKDERLAVTVFDRSTMLLSGMNWLRWIYLDGRSFDDRRRVEARLDEILARQEKASQS
ncbi:MAG: phosphotransferase [Pirellulaceae bacterium]